MTVKELIKVGEIHSNKIGIEQLSRFKARVFCANKAIGFVEKLSGGWGFRIGIPSCAGAGGIKDVRVVFRLNVSTAAQALALHSLGLEVK